MFDSLITNIIVITKSNTADIQTDVSDECPTVFMYFAKNREADVDTDG